MLLSTALGRSHCPSSSAGSGPCPADCEARTQPSKELTIPRAALPGLSLVLPQGTLGGVSFLATCDCCLLPCEGAALRRVWLHSLQNYQEVVEAAAPCPPPHLAHQCRQPQCHLLLVLPMVDLGGPSVGALSISWCIPGGAGHPWKCCSGDRDLSDSGSVQRTMGQGPRLLEAAGRFVLLREGAKNFQRSLPTSIILVSPAAPGPLSSPQMAMPFGKLQPQQQQHRITWMYKVVSGWS